MTNRMKLEILGADYAIDTVENEDYVRMLAKEIDEQASLLMQQNPKMSPNDALVLCALGFSDCYHKSEDAADRLRAQIRQYMDESERARRAQLEAQRENERLRRELDALRREEKA